MLKSPAFQALRALQRLRTGYTKAKNALAGTRLYTLVAYLDFCSVSGKSPRESLKSTTEVHHVLRNCADCYNLEPLSLQ